VRRPAQDPLDGSEGGIHKEVVTLEDISPGGVCVKVEKPVPAGTQVALLYPAGTTGADQAL